MTQTWSANYEGIYLAPGLQEGKEMEGVQALQTYYAPLSGKNVGYTGGAWDSFDPSGTRASSPDTFTAEDVLSASLLSAPIKGRAAMDLLVLKRRTFEELLTALGPDRDFAGLASVDEKGPFAPAWAIWRALCGLPGIGATRASKLLARKRPRMIPIIDSVVRPYVFGKRTDTWVPLHAALSADGGALQRRLIQLRVQAGLDEAVSALRIFDVISWMYGSGKVGEGTPVAEVETIHDAENPRIRSTNLNG